MPTPDAEPEVGSWEKMCHSAVSASSCPGALCGSVKRVRSPNVKRGSAADSRRSSRKGAPCSASTFRRRIASGRVACHLRRIRPNSSGRASRRAASQASQSSTYRTANPLTAARSCSGVLFLMASIATAIPRRRTPGISRGRRPPAACRSSTPGHHALFGHCSSHPLMELSAEPDRGQLERACAA